MTRQLVKIRTPLFNANVVIDSDDRCIREVEMPREQPLVGWNLDLLVQMLERSSQVNFGHSDAFSVEERPPA